MRRPLNTSWAPLSGNSGTPPGQTIRFPVRSVWELPPEQCTRQLAWTGRPIIPAAETNPFKLLAPSVLVQLKIGGQSYSRLAGMQGSVIVPPGAGVSLALASPLYMPAGLVDPANNVDFSWAGGQLVATCDEALAGAVDACSLHVPIISDNFLASASQFVAIPGAWVEGYSHYRLTPANMVQCQMLRFRLPVASEGSLAGSTVAPAQDLGDINAALSMGWGVDSRCATGFPLGGQVVNAYFGSKLCFFGGNLSFW